MELALIQSKLKVPKGQFNKFGKYRYRSCEDIVEALKPILADMNASLILSDMIEMIGDRYYIKATAVVLNAENKVIGTSVGYAREEESKKGMDASQITGTASSYARKYALNGLLAIDDTKDADTSDHKNEVDNTPEESKDPVVLQVDEHIVKKLQNCKTLNALQQVWVTIPEDDRSKYTEIKNQLKEKLNESG